MDVTVKVRVNGINVPLTLDRNALAAIAAAIPAMASPENGEFLTVVEAAELLRCPRQRIDDLLSQRRLTRVKDGRRTLLRRSEVDAYLETRS